MSKLLQYCITEALHNMMAAKSEFKKKLDIDFPGGDYPYDVNVALGYLEETINKVYTAICMVNDVEEKYMGKMKDADVTLQEDCENVINAMLKLRDDGKSLINIGVISKKYFEEYLEEHFMNKLEELDDELEDMLAEEPSQEQQPS